MTRPIEAVVAEAQQRLQQTGRLDIAAFVAAYPEHAEELRELLPVMLTLHQEKQWQEAEAASRAFAVGLFDQLAEQSSAAAPAGVEPASPAQKTLGALFARQREEARLSLEEQARMTGLPVEALKKLSEDDTPITKLDNATVKRIASRVAAPFAALLKEVRRLASLESLSGSGPAMVFTRDRETSTTEEQQALLEKVREAAKKPPEKRE